MCNDTGQPDAGNLAFIQLNEQEQRHFAELLANPPAPNDAMMALGALQGFTVRSRDVRDGGCSPEFFPSVPMQPFTVVRLRQDLPRGTIVKELDINTVLVEFSNEKGQTLLCTPVPKVLLIPE